MFSTSSFDPGVAIIPPCTKWGFNAEYHSNPLDERSNAFVDYTTANDTVVSR